MMFVYKFDVLDALKKRGYNTSVLRRYKLLGETEIQKLRHNEIIGIAALHKVCVLLDLQPGRILQYIPDQDRETVPGLNDPGRVSP